MLAKQAIRLRRKKRIRGKVNGTAERPRLSVYRSAKHIYVQAVDDFNGATLACASTMGADAASGSFDSKSDAARAVGKLLAEALKEKGVAQAVFDRNGYIYHGRVKALAEAAREAGLKF